MSTFERWAVWTTSALTGLTGLVYWWMTDWLEPLDEFAVINHPLQPWVLKAHVLTAPLMVFAIGMVSAEHIWRQFRLRIRPGRLSGLLAMWMLVPMIATGYLIQAVTSLGWLQALAWTHLATGCAYLLGLLLHHPIPRRFVHPLMQRRRLQRLEARASASAAEPRQSSDPYGRTDSSVGTTRSTRKGGSR